MPARKNRLKNQKEGREALRFTPDDIVRAIEAVEQAGLTVYGLEITSDGSIKINTASPFRHGAASKAETNADTTAGVQTNKKRA